MTRASVLSCAAFLLVSGAVVPAVAHATPLVRYIDYANCKAMNKVYAHGVGRKGAHDHTSGSSKPVTDFYRNTRLYKINESHDADHDGVACERD